MGDMDWKDQLAAQAEDDYEVQDLVEWLSNEDSDFAKSLVTFYDDKGFLTPSQMTSAKGMREQATDPVTEPGMYMTPEGVMLKVKRAKKGHLYALAYDEDTEDWELLKGGMRNLRGSMRVGGL